MEKDNASLEVQTPSLRGFRFGHTSFNSGPSVLDGVLSRSCPSRQPSVAHRSYQALNSTACSFTADITIRSGMRISIAAATPLRAVSKHMPAPQ